MRSATVSRLSVGRCRWQGRRSLRAMRGYDAESYGEAFADVYDDWYAGLTDVDVTVRAISRPRRAGRHGCSNSAPAPAGWPCRSPEAGHAVTGIDTSSRCSIGSRPATLTAWWTVIVGDMVDDLPPGPFDLAFVAYNTIFNLLTEARQRCLLRGASRRRCGPGGRVRRRGVRARSGGDRRPGRDRAVDGGRPRRAVGVRASRRDADRERPVRRDHRGGRGPPPTVVDPLGDTRATRRHGDRRRLHGRVTLGRHVRCPVHRRQHPPRHRLPPADL